MPETELAPKRLVLIGRDARLARAIIDLDYPPRPVQHKLFIIVHDEDVHLLHGYAPGEIVYIPMGPSKYQLNFLECRGHQAVSLEQAREWVKTHL